MIVRVLNYRAIEGGAKKETGDTSQSNQTPFSLHNYNSFITPSPHVPFPEKPIVKPNQNGKPSESAGDKTADKENMPAPGQSGSQKESPKPIESVVVLFPSPQANLVDMQLLATTPAVDLQTYRRNQAAGRAAGHPPTPLTAVPPTPTFPTGRSPKRPKMVIDETNAYEFEAALLRETSPRLYLEPTKDLYESLALMDAITHPNNKNPPPPRKSRKRTVAELAADEAEAADVQRFMLAGDEFQSTKAAATAGGEDGQPAVRDPNFQTFSRFKALQQIRMQHEEAGRRKKEEEMLQSQAKKQAQELEAKKRKEMEAQKQQAEQAAAMRQNLLQQQQQQQAQQAMQQDQAMRAVTQAQQMAGSNATQPTPQSATQPQFSSPVVRQQTPMAAAASPLVAAHSSHPMGGTPMVASSSNHGAAGSPPRPPSAVSHHAAAMARSLSQQQNQPMSRTGTPQMIQGTPVMSSAGPARNMAATPQPRMNQGSPTIGMQGGTPIMMQTPQTQAGHASMTPEQLQQIQNQQLQQQRMRMIQQQQGLQPGGQNLTPQQMALMRANAHIQAHGTPQNVPLQTYKAQLAQQYYREITMQQQNPQVAMNAARSSVPIPGQQAPVPMGQQPGMNTNMANLPPAQRLQQQQQQLNNLKAQYTKYKQTYLNTYGQNPQAFPQQVQNHMGTMEVQIRQREGELRQMMMAMGGQPQLQQYQHQLQQQRAQQARQNHLMAMQRQGMSANQMQQNMMGNMGMMNMSAQNAGGMQNPGGMNMQNLGVMNGAQMGQLNQTQQMQLMMMQQQQQQQQQRQQAQMMNHQQRPQGDGSGLEWAT